MNKRARVLVSVVCTLVLGVCALFVARPAYAVDSMFTLSVNGVRTTIINSLADLQEKLNAQDGKNKTIIIIFNKDVTGGPLELPSKSTITINLNGHTLNRGLKKADSKGHALLVKKNSKVTINGGTETATKPVNAWNKDGHNIGWQVEASGLITGGYSTNKAGGIHLDGGVRLTLNDVTVAGNRAEQKGGSDGYGGGIWACGSDTMVSLNNSQICHNYAYNDGGGICSTSSQFNLFMSNSKVQFNGAKRNGGGIALLGDKAVVTGDPRTVVGYNNCYGTYGGGVYINKDNVSVGGFTVEGNEAKYGGGVATRDHTITLSSLTVQKNTAEYGGGVYVGDFTNLMSTASDTMNGCVITKNTTRNNSSWGKGAGVYVVGGGRGWFVKSFSLEVGGKTIVKDNGAGSGNLIFGSTGVHPNFTLTGESDVRMGYEKISEDAVQVTHDRLKGPNCIRYLTPENGGYHFTYNPSASSRKIFYVKNGKDNEKKYGSAYGQRQTIGKITSAAAASKVDGSKSYNGYPVTRGYVRFPSAVEEKVDLATPFFYSDGYFFDNPETYNTHLATASMCMAMSGFYLNTGDINATGGYVNKHASARQFMADIGCDDQSIYVNDFNVQKPGIDTIGVTIAHKRLKNKDGKDSDYYLIPVAIRGANYEAEWTSNVTLNKAKDVQDAEAAGFASAADKVYKEIRAYMQRYNIQPWRCRFWVAGYSRAGATTNLVCKRLIDAWRDAINNKPKVFGYPMEAPQGGTNTTYDDRLYYSIHNVINQADLVPLVAPTAMGFKRYGVDHYIPGTNAGAPRIAENDAVTRGGTGGPARRYLYADNYAYQTNSTQYSNAGVIAQLRAIDPNIVFDDYFATCGMDFAPSPSIYEKSTGKVSVYEEKFIKDFLNEVQVGAIANRDVYASDLEPIFRTVMGMLFGMEPSRTKAFVDRASTTMNRFDTLVASWNDHGMLRIWWSLIGEWNKSSEAKKKEYTDLFYKKLKETEALDVLTKEERAKFDAAWPKLFDFIMRVLDRDYNTKSYKTAKMMMLGTFAYNSSRIMANHYPEITLAWLRTYDDYYNNERTSVAINNAPSVSAPSASVGKTNLKAGGQVNEIPGGKQTVTLDVTNIKGEAIYYKMSGAKTSANTCKTGYEIYRGGIDLGKANKDAEYTITAYAMSYGTKSAEVTYKIKATGARHKVVVYNEYNAHRKNISQTYEWDEGTQQKVEVKETAEQQLDDWRVWDEKGRDVTGVLLPNGEAKKKTATFTMPEGGENGFSETYKLTFSASFKWRPMEYPKHTFTVKVGNSTETFQAAECKTFTYDATNKIPAGKYFKEWKVTDQAGNDVTRFMRYRYRSSSTEDYVWRSRYKPNMSCEVTGNNQTVDQTNEPKSYTFAQGYSLTFEAQLEDIATVNKIEITGVVKPMLYGSGKTTIKYYAGANEVHQLYQYAGWKCSQSKTKNEDTTVTTTTTYTNYINCPAVAGKSFAADDKLSIKAEVDGKSIENDPNYKITWIRKDDGTIQVTITKVETSTKGTPTYTYQVEARACDKNDADRAVLRQGDKDLASTQSFKAGADGVFRFYNGPTLSGDNWKFCGYEAAADSGLEKVNTNNPLDNTFKVVDKNKPLVVNMLYVPEISEIEVTQFPQPVTGEPFAGKDDGRIDSAYILSEGSVFADAFETRVKNIVWSPAPGADQRAAADTAYTAELELECVDEDGQPYECAFEQRGVSVTTSAENPAFESAEFNPAASKLTLCFLPTTRDIKHQVTVVDYAKDDNSDDAKPKTYMWDEGEAKSITAKSYDDYVFSGWSVSDSTKDVAEKLGLNEAALKQSTLAFVMPGRDVLGDDYQLFLMASYVPKAQSLRAIIAAPTEADTGTSLANKATIKWKATEESEQREVEVPVAWSASVQSSGTDTETWTYTATMRLDGAAAAEFVSGTIEVTAGPSDAEDYTNVTSNCVRNADGSITVSAVFPPIQTPAIKEDVTIEAFDANTMSKFASVSDTELSVAWDMNDAGEFELLPPAIKGATFVGWEVPSDSKVKRVGTTGNKFKIQDGTTAQDSTSVHALYAPEVSSVTIAGVAAPVGGQPLTALDNNNVTATLNFSDATKTLFGETTLPGGTDDVARVKVTSLTWKPAATGDVADYETSYTAEAKFTARRVVNEVEQEDGSWRFIYARGAGVQAEGASTTRLNAAANMAYLYFPQTGRDKGHQVSITNSTYNTEGEQYVDIWYEGIAYTAVAREIDDKLFSEWTVVDGGGADVAAKLGLSEDALKSESLRITMPAYTDGGDFAKDYSLTITANYTDKLGAITATVPQPNPEAEQLPAKATLKWGNAEGQSAEVDLWWEWQGQTEQSGESKTITDTYTAVMQLDAEKAQLFASEVTVAGATTSEEGPQVKENGSTWIWNPDGSATITVLFNPIVTNVEARKVVAQACDFNANGQSRLEGTTDEEVTMFVDELGPFAVYAPEVEGAEFAGWAVPEKVAQVDAPQPDQQDGTNVSEDGLTIGFFQFANDAPAGQTYTIKALYKPVVDVVQTVFEAPKAGQEMATTGNASFTLQNNKFSPVNVAVSGLEWSPMSETDGTAAYGKEYDATVTLAPAAGKQFVYAADLLPDYEVPDEGDEDDAALVSYTAEEPAHTMYVSFYATEQPGLLNITEPNPIVATNDKNNMAAIKDLLPDQVDIEVVGSNVNKATVTWGDPVCDENGGKAYESFWHVEGTVTLPEGVNPPADVEAKDLKVSAFIYVSPADKLNLLDVEQPADLLDVDPDSDIMLQLPTTTTLTMEDGIQEDVEVEWNGTPTLVENGEDVNVSVWTVTGRVKEPLPNWINNPEGEDHVDLSLSLNVYVNPPDRRHEPADTPYATLEDGAYDLSQIIYLDTYNPNATIYYNTDARAEVKDFVEYTRGTPIHLDRTTTDEYGFMTIQAYAAEEDKDPSEPVTYLYLLNEAIDPPEGEELVFNGKEQTGVWSNDNFSLLDPSNGARIDEYDDAVATNVGTYTVRAHIADKLQWVIGEADEDGNVPTTTDDQTATFKIVPASVKDCDIDPIDAQAYAGGAAEPKPVVMLDDYVAVEGRDYTLTYEDNVGVGKARVTITGTGNLVDSVTLEFDIVGGDSLPVSYSGHVQNTGDINAVANGDVLGTTGKSLRLEALKATVDGGSIEYRTHVQNTGWQDWVADGEQAGTTGQSLRMEALQMKPSARLAAAGYHTWYRVHVQNVGWMGWASDGAPAGTTGYSRRIEAVQLLVLRGDKKPDDYDAAKSAFRTRITANAHVQRDGWLGWDFVGVFGTTGQSKRLEAMWAKVSLPYESGIEYQGHVQNYGWQDWVADGAVAGTTGQSLRMEAVRMKLTGEAAGHLSLWYRAHVQNVGWTDWVRDGADAGTTGRSLRAEAVEVIVLSKDAVPWA